MSDTATNYKTVAAFITEHPEYKPSSLYAALRNAITRGALRGKAIPLNRNDVNGGKFTLAKGVVREGKESDRNVTNFVLLDMDAVNAWFEANKGPIRRTVSMSKTGVVMPKLEDITSGKYTPEQLAELAEHAATKRYGSHRTGKGTTQNLEGTAKPVRKGRKATADQPSA